MFVLCYSHFIKQMHKNDNLRLIHKQTKKDIFKIYNVINVLLLTAKCVLLAISVVNLMKTQKIVISRNVVSLYIH